MTRFFDEVLRLPPQAVLFEVQRRLVTQFPGRHVMQTAADLFAVERFVFEQQATTTLAPAAGEVLEHWCDEDGQKVTANPMHRWETVCWEGHAFEVVTLTLRESGNSERAYFIVADTRELAKRFFLAVCRWCSSTRGEVLVFENGVFRRSEQLFAQIHEARLDELILAPGLGEAISADVRRFTSSKALYAQHRVPWKRGLLFLGAPGNGKTHLLRALVREAGWQCLYVKSFHGRNCEAENGISRVFARARRAAPCVVVLEDLDCLVDDESRSVLLNELDGFAQNDGLLIIATTNHPEKIDRALLDRPSRFDRKFHFPLPEPRERRRYLERWRESLEPALRFTDDTLHALADGSSGFTFAYLKELTFGAMMAFIDAGRPMDEVAPEVLAALRRELTHARKLLPPSTDTERKISLAG